MVLQRDKSVPVWGRSKSSEKVIVSFAGQTKECVPDDTGKWMLKLDAMETSRDGRVMTITSGAEKIELKDILVGEVWLASGQSNMLGFGKPSTLKGIAAEKYPYLVDDDGEWTVRKDVRNVFVMCSGNSPAKDYKNEWMTISGNIGPEMGIGHHVGDLVVDLPGAVELAASERLDEHTGADS